MTSHILNQFPYVCKTCGTRIKKYCTEFQKLSNPEETERTIMFADIRKLERNEILDKFFTDREMKSCCKVSFLTYIVLPF